MIKYTWHIFGAIENTPVNISMTSSPTTFASVEPRSQYSFPAREPSLQDLRNQVQRAGHRDCGDCDGWCWRAAGRGCPGDGDDPWERDQRSVKPGLSEWVVR